MITVPRLPVLVLLAGLFACTGVTMPTPSATPATQPTAAVEELPDDVLVIYHKSGGIAGIDETLTVHQGGLVVLETRLGEPKSIQVEHPVILPLRNFLQAKEFAALESDYSVVGADLISYTVTTRDRNGKVKIVHATDGAELPDYLGLVIVALEQLRGAMQ